jgi:hypothetical protein
MLRSELLTGHVARGLRAFNVYGPDGLDDQLAVAPNAHVSFVPLEEFDEIE